MSDTYITNQPVIPPNQNDVAAWKQAYIDLYALGREATDDYLQARARIAELEQELAQRWEPVNEKFILTYDTGLVDTPKQFVRWNADDESVIVGKDDGSFYHCPLPDDIRLCRLVERAESQPTYSHRNGETEPPTVNGWYWYYHEDDWYGMYHVTGDRYELGPISGVLSEEFEGQWWGPVVAPWEVDHD